MRILGIADGQSSGATIVEDGRILAAINEERISRIKMARGFPWQSIEEVLRLSNMSPEDISEVAVGTANMEFREQVAGWPGWFEAREEDRNLHSSFFQIASRYGNIATQVPGLKSAYYALRKPAFLARRKRIQEILRQDYQVSAPVNYFHHHFAHAASAYYTSNFDDALVVTMDGGGDRHSCHIYSVRSGNFKKLCIIDSYNSLGNYYAYITAICGFKAKRHEGKITGLAARGKPKYLDLLRSFIDYENGRSINRGKVLFATALDRIQQELPEHWTREDLAASIQILAEEIATRIVAHWVEKTGHENVALAGGLFANVRINEEIHSLPSVDNTFIHPGMTDEGEAVGAALALQGKIDRRRGKRYEPEPLKDVYFGTGYDEHAICQALANAELEAEHLPGRVEAKVAEHLANGKVVARFNGRMEYGPRALGNRSILYQPGDPSVNDWLNELLRRTEFMPFAPSCLGEYVDELFVGTAGAIDAARFMTITFHCTPWMTERCGGVVHVDQTARPQLVKKEDNLSYYKIIDEYRKLTGVPVVINTSFNIHEEPIVRSPEDAIRAFLDSSLDYLAIGDYLVKGPVGSMATRKKWEGRSKWGRAEHEATAR